MIKRLTDEQFVKGLALSTQCARKKWQYSTDMILARKIADSQDKDETILKLQQIVNETEDEQEAIAKMEAL